MDPLGITGSVVDDKYAVDDAVAEGGFATVYRAMHLVLKRPVAIKVFHAAAQFSAEERAALVDRFVSEATMLSDLSERTAAICQARDAGTLTCAAGSLPYMVLEWLEGRTLEAVLEEEQRDARKPRTIEEAMRWLEPIAVALHVAHERGIAHRDIKPSNIFILDDNQTPKLLDFGIAKIVQDNSEPFSRTGRRSSFTPAYGAPEQFTPELGATGPWTDVFSFALVLTEIVTGQAPLLGRTVGELGNAALNPQRRPTPRTLGASVGDGAEAVFKKALAIDPKDRYATVGEMWSALESGVIELADAPVPRARPKREDFVERDRHKMLSSPRIDRAPSSPQLPSPSPPSSARPSPKESDERGERAMRRIELGLAGLGLVCTLVFAALTARESWGFGKYQLERGFQASTCVIDSVQGDGDARTMNVRTRGARQLRGVARESDAIAPTPGFGGAEPEPATFTRVVGAEVPCFFDPSRPEDVLLRRWTTFALWPLLLLASAFGASFYATRWMFRRLRA